MKIIVCGCGKIGEALVSALAAEGHIVTAIDRDAAVVTALANVEDVMGVCGNGADCALKCDGMSGPNKIHCLDKCYSY